MEKARGGLGYWSGEGAGRKIALGGSGCAGGGALGGEGTTVVQGRESRVDWKVAGAREGRPRRGTKEE